MAAHHILLYLQLRKSDWRASLRINLTFKNENAQSRRSFAEGEDESAIEQSRYRASGFWLILNDEQCQGDSVRCRRWIGTTIVTPS